MILHLNFPKNVESQILSWLKWLETYVDQVPEQVWVPLEMSTHSSGPLKDITKW